MFNHTPNELLIDNKENYRLLFENSKSPIMCFNTKGRIILANEEARKNLSLPKTAYINKSLYDFLPEKTAQFHMDRFSKIIKTGKSTIDFRARINKTPALA